MKRLLKAMWYALLPLIAILVIPATIQEIVCGLEALGLNEGTSVMLTLFIFAYVVGVLFYYYED